MENGDRLEVFFAQKQLPCVRIGLGGPTAPCSHNHFETSPLTSINLSGRLSIALRKGALFPETREITNPPSRADTASCARSIARTRGSPQESSANRANESIQNSSAAFARACTAGLSR